MRIAEADILIVPDLGNAPPAHWQRRWEGRLPNGRIVEQADWVNPDRDAWVDELSRTIMMATRPVVLIAHSLGVAAVVHAAAGFADTKVRGALLVAPLDLDRKGVPAVARTFAPLPRDPLPFPSLLVASRNDPNCSLETAADLAAAWGSDFHDAGEAGHIDLASEHGPWPEGLLMLTRLMQRI